MQKRISLTHIAIILCLFVFAFSTYSIAQEKDGLLKIYFFDVGQGDAIFMEAPNGNQILIDGGSDNKVLQKLGEVMSFYDRDIDAVVVSHPHADHIAGLIWILERYEVKNIIEAKETYNSSEFKAWEDGVQKEGTNITEAVAGKEIDLGSGVILSIIHPFESVAGTTTSKPHDDVVVGILKYKDFKLMLTGDMEAKVERSLIMNEYNMDTDVLKVGHHGSKTSTTKEFLSEVSPQAAIIQVGSKNRYGHPSPEVLKRFDDYGIKYYRTDVDGDIKILSDGKNYKIEKY